MHRLAISLLGPFEVTLAGEPVTRFGADTARALLAYLALHSRTAHRRETLAGLLWPDQPESEARHNLAQALHRLRQAIGDRTANPPFLEITRQTIGLHPEGDAWVDVAAFRDALAACRGHRHRRIETCGACARWFEEAAALYRGEFMAGFSLDSALYEEWLVVEREELHRGALDVLRDLAGYHEAQGAYEEAIRYARRQIELEEWREEAHRQVMRGLALSGDRAGALAQYEACRRALTEELGVEPEMETRALYECIRAGEDVAPRGLPPPHSLPAYLTPFVGRKEYLTEIADRLADRECRLLTLVGPGGIGKTRLAVEAARGQIEQYEDGVFFVSLAPVDSAEAIVGAIAGAVGLMTAEGGSLGQRLAEYLRGKETLLVLDNFEHLVDGAGLVTELLKVARSVKIVVTSRERLGVRGEHLFPVAGMACPDQTSQVCQTCDVSDAARYSAVRLFLSSARQSRPDLSLTADNAQDVVRICQLVQGMPLAIELAASWIEVLSPAEIADQIASGLDFLETDLRDVPQRHRSMRAVFDASWGMLSTAEQEAFARLSVFRGGFTREAAQAVAGADLRALKTLVRKSFLQRDPTGRYSVHELLRQYAEERLGQAGERERTLDEHCAYYAEFFASRAFEMRHQGSPEALIEMDNLWVASRWAVESNRVADIRQFVGHFTDSFYALYDAHGRLEEGEALLGQAVDVLRASEPSAENQVALGVALRVQGYLSQEAGHRERALQLVEESRSLLRRLDAQQEYAISNIMAFLLGGRNRRDAQGEELLKESLAICQETSFYFGQSWTLFLLGGIARARGDYETAERCFRQTLEIGRAEGRHSGLAWALCALGSNAYLRGAYGQAKQYHAESLVIFEKLGWLPQVADLHNHVGDDALAMGEYEEARGHYEEALATARHVGFDQQIVRSLLNLGNLALSTGIDGEARQHYRQALEVAMDRSNVMLAAVALLGPANWLAQRADDGPPVERAVELAALILRTPDWSGLGKIKGRGLLDRLKGELPSDVFAAAQERGRGRDLWATVEELLAELGA